MGLIASLPDIDKWPQAVYVLHEKLERFIPVHQHKKGQLSYVEGGIAYVRIHNKTFVIPARHYFWIPQGVPHLLKVSHSATVLRSIFFYTYDDDREPFYSKVGIYPINDLLLQMFKYTDKWDGPIEPDDKRHSFLTTIKNLLPEISTRVLPIALPSTDNERTVAIMQHMEKHIADVHTLHSIGEQFGLSSRSLSRLFQADLGISFLQYLKLLRMVKAFEMILQTDIPMSEIAYSIGYQSLSAFSNTFYRVTNLRPSSFSDFK
jgi:AraC-like DNA-binding protein